MKAMMRKIFSPILGYFESGEDEYSYKKSHRTILVVVGCLFLVLCGISAAAAVVTSQLGAIVPLLVFFSAGLVCLVVGAFGADRAVAKIWGNK